MDSLQVLVLNVKGAEAIGKALEIASQVIGRGAIAGTLELTAAPAAAPVIEAPAAGGKIFYCKRCPETFDSVGRLAAHSRATHPKGLSRQKKSDLSAGAEMNGEIWCPQKNCGRSFHKRGWLNLHLEKNHGVSL